jgi:hypothetical protein
MNRYMVGLAVALLLAPGGALMAQTRARVEYRNGRIGVGVDIGRLPVRVTPHGPTARGWVSANWGPLRVRVDSRQAFRRQGTLDRTDLRYLLGKETVKDIEKHAKRMGIKGRTRGQWFREDRNTTVLEVTVDRIPVAELYDYRSDGSIDELFLTGPRRYTQKDRGRYRRDDRGRYRWNDIWDR